MFETFLVAIIFFTLGALSLAFIMSVFVMLVLFNALVNLSGDVESAVGYAIEEAYSMAKLEQLSIVSLN